MTGEPFPITPANRAATLRGLFQPSHQVVDVECSHVSPWTSFTALPGPLSFSRPASGGDKDEGRIGGVFSQRVR